MHWLAEFSVCLEALAFTWRELKSAVGRAEDRPSSDKAVDGLGNFEMVERQSPQRLGALATFRE